MSDPRHRGMLLQTECADVGGLTFHLGRGHNAPSRVVSSRGGHAQLGGSSSSSSIMSIRNVPYSPSAFTVDIAARQSQIFERPVIERLQRAPLARDLPRQFEALDQLQDTVT